VGTFSELNQIVPDVNVVQQPAGVLVMDPRQDPHIKHRFQQFFYCYEFMGARGSWLRHYATSRKVAGSIPDEVIGFFD
jgi:hypothetical protein